MIEIDKRSIYLVLDNKTVKEACSLPIGGKPVTPEEEIIMGQQLKRELDDYKRPIIESRTKVLQAMSGIPAFSIED